MTGLQPKASWVLIASCLAALLCAPPARAQAKRYVAYEVPEGTSGNQAYGGSLGMDFNVELDIVVTRLGVFDSGSDGLSRAITARLFNRETLEELAVLDFTTDDAGELVGGSRFKPLEAPIDLPAGFQGTIVAHGYGDGELNGNQGGADLKLTTDDGGCSIAFVGGGRFGDAGSFPTNPDTGPVDRYAAGTFEFEATESLIPKGAVPYLAPAGTAGNQSFGGALGLDFNVNVPLIVKRLGVFDSNSDGLRLPLTARLYHRDTEVELASLAFTPEDAGDPVEGHRFKTLDPPFRLPAGLRCTIVGEGYGDLEMNGNRNVGFFDIVTDSGGCAISFVGNGRFGGVPGAFPGSRDGGPPPTYAAGSLEFELDPSPPDPPPDFPADVAAKAGDGKVELSWRPSAGATPAVSYKVFRAAAIGGPYAQIAQVPETVYTDAPVTNDVPVCYFVRAVAANAQESFDSARRCALPSGPPPAGRSIAYKVEGGVVGNQAYTGALGMDFDVRAPIRIFRLGVFDSGADGLGSPIAARLFDRDLQTELAKVDFGPDDPGALVDGSRFKALPEPLVLPEGFHGTMSASGYGAAEPNGNLGVGPLTGLSTDDGGCRIAFVGGGRFGNDPNGFPATVDGGPANRYAAGTFDFEADGPPVPKEVVPPTGLRAETEGERVFLSWIAPVPTACVAAAARYKVLRSTDGGAFEEVAQPTVAEHADSGLAAGTDACYVVRSIAETNEESPDSALACATFGRTIAYEVPFGTPGNQNFPGALGMDFDVLLDIRVTRLGVFDSGSDGLLLPITVRLYDRDTEGEIVSLDFGPDEPGLLLNGSRFLEVTPPIELSAGFRGSIVAEGFGDLELNGNGGLWLTNPGPCSLYFTGRGRYGTELGLYPPTVDQGGPDQYAAGTFQFEPAETASPRAGDGIAYMVPDATIGNQNFNGPLGLDFDLNADLEITRLGAFDSGSDGLFLPITVEIYDRTDASPLASLAFTPEDAGELVGGSRFKDLAPPLSLRAGFQGSVVAVGYGNDELNGNLVLGGPVPWTTDDGGCAISFVGGGRFGPVGTTGYPAIVDGGPVNRYAAGTFQYRIGLPPLSRFVRGDADASGVIDLTDAIYVLGFLFLGGPAPPCMDAADIDNLGTAALDVTDGIYLLTYLFLGGPAPALPFPAALPYTRAACGVDPADPADTMDCQAFAPCR